MTTFDEIMSQITVLVEMALDEAFPPADVERTARVQAETMMLRTTLEAWHWQIPLLQQIKSDQVAGGRVGVSS